MMWLIPRSDPGALTEYRRPHAGAVSTIPDARLPYGAFPRLVMLWMYAECARAAQDPPQYRDPVFSILDFLFTVEIDAMEARPLFVQADRLFACRFTTGGRTMPVIDPSFVRSPDEAQRLPQVASGRGWTLAHGEAFRHALAERRFEPRLAIVRALRRRPFALDVYLWDAGYGDCAPSRRSRLGAYHALAERPLRTPGVGDVLAFERELARVRDNLRRLEREAGPDDEGLLLG